MSLDVDHYGRQRMAAIGMALEHSLARVTQSLKAFVREIELDELTGRRLVGRVKAAVSGRELQHSAHRRAGVCRWRQTVDFRWSAAMPGRPRNDAGATSFHLRIETFSKPGGDARATRSDGGLAAAGFDAYVADRLAVGQIDGAAFDGYLADATAPSPTIATDVGSSSMAGSRVVLLLSSIGDDQAARDAFWRAREMTARRRGGHVVELVPDRATADEWAALAITADLPPGVRAAIAAIAAERAGGAAPDAIDRRARVIEVELREDSDIAWAANLGDRFGTCKQTRMLHHRAPRGGRVQERLVLELPGGLNPTEIEEIVHPFVAPFERLGLPFTLAVHRPDAENDDRNWHVHVVWYPQTGERNRDGEWTFPTRKLRPGELASAIEPDVAASVMTRHHRLRAAEDIATLRRSYERLCNAVLESGGHTLRYDARTYLKQGIRQHPAEHLGSAEARLASVGVATPTDLVNAARYWRAETDRRFAAIEARAAKQNAVLDALAGDVGGRGDYLVRHVALVAAHDALLADQRAIVSYDLLREQARSRALRVEDYCVRILDLVASGRASKADAAAAAMVERRLGLARHHLLEVDGAVEPWQAEIDRMRAGLAEREAQLRDAVATLDRDVREAIVRADMLVDKCRRLMVHVELVDGGSRFAIDALPEAEVVLTDPIARGRAWPALDGIAHLQRLAIDRVAQSILTKGRDATATATRGVIDELRAEAVLYRRYETHGYAQRQFAAAEARWRRRIADETARAQTEEVTVEIASAYHRMADPTTVATNISGAAAEPPRSAGRAADEDAGDETVAAPTVTPTALGVDRGAVKNNAATPAPVPGVDRGIANSTPATVIDDRTTAGSRAATSGAPAPPVATTPAVSDGPHASADAAMPDRRGTVPPVSGRNGASRASPPAPDDVASSRRAASIEAAKSGVATPSSTRGANQILREMIKTRQATTTDGLAEPAETDPSASGESLRPSRAELGDPAVPRTPPMTSTTPTEAETVTATATIPSSTTSERVPADGRKASAAADQRLRVDDAARAAQSPPGQSNASAQRDQAAATPRTGGGDSTTARSTPPVTPAVARTAATPPASKSIEQLRQVVATRQPKSRAGPARGAGTRPSAVGERPKPAAFSESTMPSSSPAAPVAPPQGGKADGAHPGKRKDAASSALGAGTDDDASWLAQQIALRGTRGPGR